MKRRKQNLLWGALAGVFCLSWGSVALGEGTAVIGGADGPTSIFIAEEENDAEAFRSEDPKEAAEAFLRGFYTIGFSEAEFFLDAFLAEQKQIVLEEEKQTEQTGEQDDSDGEESSEELEVSVIGEDVEEPYVLSYDSVLGAIREISPYEYMTEEAWEDWTANRGPTRLYGLAQDAGEDLTAEEITLEETSREEEEVRYSFEVSVEGAGEENGFSISGQMDLILGTDGVWMVDRLYEKEMTK